MSEPGGPRRPRGRPTKGAAPVAPNDDLLPLALEAFADLGYEGASMRASVPAAGGQPQPAAPALRLEGSALVRRGRPRVRARSPTAWSPSPAPSEYDDDLARLRFLMVRWLEITAASPALAKIINQEAATGGPRLDYMFDRYIWPVTRTVTHFLGELERDGRVREVDPGTWHFLVMHGAGGPLSLPRAGRAVRQRPRLGRRGPSLRDRGRRHPAVRHQRRDLRAGRLDRPARPVSTTRGT